MPCHQQERGGRHQRNFLCKRIICQLYGWRNRPGTDRESLRCQLTLTEGQIGNLSSPGPPIMSLLIEENYMDCWPWTREGIEATVPMKKRIRWALEMRLWGRNPFMAATTENRSIESCKLRYLIYIFAWIKALGIMPSINITNSHSTQCTMQSLKT